MSSQAEAQAIPADVPLVTRVSALLRSAAAAEFIVVLAGSLAIAALLAWRAVLLTTSNPVFSEPGWDHHAYIAMARDNPFDLHLAPFGWRFLVPLTAKILPFSLQASFLGIALCSIAGAMTGLYYLGRRVGGHRAFGVLAVLLFVALGWAAKFTLVDFWLPDAALYLAVTAAILCILDRRPLLFATVLLIGVGVKEAAIFVAPLWYTLHATRLADRRLALQAVLLMLPAVTLLLAVRLLIPAQNADDSYAASLSPGLQVFREYIPSYNYYDLLRDIGWHTRLHDRRADTLLAYTTETWGLGMLVLAMVGAIRRPVLALRLAPFLALVYAQLLFALNIERLLVLGFPVMIWLALEGARAILQPRPSLGPWALLALGAPLAALTFKNAGIPLRFELEVFAFVVPLAVFLAWPPRIRGEVGKTSLRSPPV